MQTIYPALFRKINPSAVVERIRIDTPDKDFLDIDIWRLHDSDKVVIISHGLEGSSTRAYVTGIANTFYHAGYNVLAWNFRGCSGELNNQPVLYHSGATYDLETLIHFAQNSFKEINLVGFSLGGNLTLKYLGEQSTKSKIHRAVAISSPLDLLPGVIHLNRSFNRVYEIRFLRSLKKKLKQKAEQYPDLVDLKKLEKIKTLYEFDDQFTARIHGFKNAKDYYEKCSSKKFITEIKSPTLILNAMNDPLLTKESKNISYIDVNPNVEVIITKEGGHVGYSNFINTKYWSEEVALKFVRS